MKFYKLTIILILFILCSCDSNQGQFVLNKKNKQAKEEPSLHIEGFNITETLSGVKQWELKSNTADIYEKKNIINIVKVEITFYGKDQIFSDLSADTGDLDLSNKNVLVKNNVKVISKKDIILETDKLLWDAQNQVFKTDAPVKIIKNNSIITGVGFVSSPGLENIKILENVQIKAYRKG